MTRGVAFGRAVSALTAVGAVLAGPGHAAGGIEVPSGQPVALLERLVDAPDPAGQTWRYRFLAPQIARGAPQAIDFETAGEDMGALCAQFILPDVRRSGLPAPARVVITLMDRPVPFGEPAPDATQFIEAYALSEGACQWEAF